MQRLTSLKGMIVLGTWDWNLGKIETDSGVCGAAEAYWDRGACPALAKSVGG